MPTGRLPRMRPIHPRAGPAEGPAVRPRSILRMTATSAAERDEVDLDARARREGRDADRRSRREVVAHVLGVDAVERLVVVLEARQERTGGDHVAQREAGVLEDDREVVHDAAGLGLDVAERVLAGLRVGGHLAGDEDEVAGAGGVAVGRLVEGAGRRQAFDHARGVRRGPPGFLPWTARQARAGAAAAAAACRSNASAISSYERRRAWWS